MRWTSGLLKIGALGAFATTLAGCSAVARTILAPQQDTSKFYVLTPTADPPSAPANTQTSAGDFTLGLGPIKLPPYLDRPEVVTHTAPNQLDLSQTDPSDDTLQNHFTTLLSRGP